MNVNMSKVEVKIKVEVKMKVKVKIIGGGHWSGVEPSSYNYYRPCRIDVPAKVCEFVVTVRQVVTFFRRIQLPYSSPSRKSLGEC